MNGTWLWILECFSLDSLQIFSLPVIITLLIRITLGICSNLLNAFISFCLFTLVSLVVFQKD